MKKKIICLILSISIIASISSSVFASDYDHPKAYRVVIRINEATDK